MENEYSNRYSKAPSVSSEFKNNIRKKFGVQVTNSTSDPRPSYLFKVSGNNASKNLEKQAYQMSQYAYGISEINAIYNDLGKIKNAMTEGGMKNNSLDIFRDVNAITYGKNPHTAIKNWKDAVNTDNARILGFDMETIGELGAGKNGFFSATEISFYSSNLTDTGLSNPNLERSFIVNPNQRAVSNVNEIFSKMDDFIKHGKAPMLTDVEKRTIGDLIKYSEGANFVTKNGMTELGGASPAYSNFVTGDGTLRLNTSTDSKEMMTKARQGLANLQKHGTDHDTVMSMLSQYLSEENSSKNAFFMGANIENYDIKAINESFQIAGISNGFKPNRFIDTYQLTSAIHPSALSLRKNDAVNVLDMKRASGGLYGMETLKEITGGTGGYTHSAGRDTLDNFNVANKLFFSPEAQDFIEDNVLMQGGTFNNSTATGTFNTKALEPGATLFSIRGAKETAADGARSFKTAFNGKKEIIDDSKFYINSHTPYEFLGTYKKDGIYGAQLKNAMTGENVYVNKGSEKELRNFIYNRFMNADKNGLTKNAMTEMYEQTRDDIARSKFRQMTNNVGYGNYKQLQGVLEAYNLEKSQGSAATSAQLQDIFSYTKNDKRIVMGNWQENYKRMRGRLTSDAPILNNIMDEVERMHGGSRDSNPNWWPTQKRHMAVIEAYQDAQKHYGKNTDIIELKGANKYGFSVMGPDGGNHFFSLRDRDSAAQSVRKLYNYTEGTNGRNRQAADSFFIDVLDKVKNHASQYQKEMGNMRYESFAYQIDEIIKPMIKNQNSSHYQINAFANLMNEYKDVIPGFKKGFMEVEGLGPRNGFTAQKMTENSSRFIRKGLEVANGFTMDYGTPQPLRGMDNSLLKTVNALDESLSWNYRAAGITDEYIKNIPTMRNTINETIQNFATSFNNRNDINLGFALFNSGTVEEPMMSMAIFDSGAKGQMADNLTNKTLDTLRGNKRAAVIDVPLISADQYLHYGNQKKISPLVMMTRDSMESQKVGLETSFSHIMHNLNGKTDEMIRAAQNGDYRTIEQIANGQVQESLGYLSGSNKYLRDSEKMYSSTAEADFLKKNYILFRGMFEDAAGEQYGMDGSKLFPSNKLAMFRSGKIFDTIKENLGIDVSLESTRGGHAINQFFLSAVENRDFVNFGMYNSAGRDNMIQMRNMRTLSRDALETIEANISSQRRINNYSGMSLNPLLITDSELSLRMMKNNGFAKHPGVNVDVANMGENEINRRLNRAASDLGYDDLRSAMGGSSAQYPSTWENQALVSQSFADSMGSIKKRQKTYALDELDESFLNKVTSSKSPYALDYMEEMGPETKFKRVSRDGGVRHFITGFNINDGKITFDIEERFKTRAGVTKLFLDSEKVTVRNVIPDELFYKAFGEGTQVAGNINHAGHHGFGEVSSGLVKQTVSRINQSDLNANQKKIALNQVQDIINRTFGLEVTVKDDIIGKEATLVIDNTKPGFRNLFTNTADISLDKLGLENISENVAEKIRRDGIVESVTGLSDNLSNVLQSNNISGALDNARLTLEARLAENSEDINFMSIGHYGKKGVKIGPRHIGLLQDGGYNEFARYLTDSVAEESVAAGRASALPGSGGFANALSTQARAIGVLQREIKGEGAVPEGSTINDYLDVLEGTKPLKRGATNSTGRGVYLERNIEGTVFDPDYRRARGADGGMWINLPEEATLEVNSKTGKNIKLKNLYLAEASIDRSGTKGRFTFDGVGRSERTIFEGLREYKAAQQSYEKTDVRDKMGRRLTQPQAMDKAMAKVNRGVQNYYNEIFHETTSSHGGAYNKRMSARLSGSGRLNLQIMSPELEIAGEVNKIETGNLSSRVKAVANRYGMREDVVQAAYDNVSESGYKGLENPNTIFISEDRAKDMMKGYEGIDDAMETLNKGEGLPGYAVREPAIHAPSGMPVEYRVDPSLDYDTVRMPATLANAQFGDSDGDRISFLMAYDKKGIKYNKEQLGVEVNQAGEQLRVLNSDGRGSWQEKTFKKFEEDVLGDMTRKGLDTSKGGDLATASSSTYDYQKSVFNIISDIDGDFAGKLDNFDRRQMTRDGFAKYIDGLSNAKLRNAAFTGMINNTMETLRRVGREYTTSQTEALTLSSAIGDLIQEPISSKHILTSKGKEALDPMDAINWVKNGDFDNFRATDVLTEKQVDVLNNVYSRATEKDAAIFDNVLNQMYLSERVEDKGSLKLLSEEIGSQIGGIEKEISEESFWKGNVSLKPSSYGRRSAKRVSKKSGAGYTLSGDAAKKMAQTTDDLVQNLSENPATRKFSGMAMMAMGVGGALLGAGAMASTQPLPMDYINQPDMMPQTGSGQREAMMDMNSVQNIINNQGMDILINGQTTIDKDIKELSGIVSQTIGSSMNIPVNINVNATDNRSQISQQWIEEKVLSALQ